MTIVIQVNAPLGSEQVVKEALAIYCERFGDCRVVEIREDGADGNGGVILIYAIITASSEYYQPTVTQILKMVSEKINEGYKPFGSLSVVERSGEFYFSQPIVKEE